MKKLFAIVAITLSFSAQSALRQFDSIETEGVSSITIRVKIVESVGSDFARNECTEKMNQVLAKLNKAEKVILLDEHECIYIGYYNQDGNAYFGGKILFFNKD